MKRMLGIALILAVFGTIGITAQRPARFHPSPEGYVAVAASNLSVAANMKLAYYELSKR